MKDESMLADPFAAYGRIREQAPLVRAAMPGVEPYWIVTRYDDVKQVLGDARFVSSVDNVPDLEVPDRMEQFQISRGIPPEFLEYLRTSMARLDGDDHLRQRRLAAHVFTARRMIALRPRVEEMVGDLLDRLPGMARDGVVDLVAHFALPLPLAVIFELVGVPEPDRPRFLATIWQWMIAAGSGKGGASPSGPGDVHGFILDLVERRRADPGTDLISSLIRVRDDDERRVGDTELVWLIMSLLIAGHETTANLIGNSVAALLTHPDQLGLLRRRPELMPKAVNELVRWCSPVVTAPHRYATEDIEVGGVLVRKGESVMVVFAGANHDPRAFDAPERLDLDREATPGRAHLGFGHGLRHCPGAALGRMEAEVALEALLRRFPDLALAADPAELRHARIPGLWKLLALPVTL
ncbi:cytochrome P450 [Actinomadura graeca]|uniref:Cytochrome P450 n=2 Tax=Actinomadura graeca TaxID=2750812 RepID=A0ABX8R925_9ACTN|nr:cytochrome P450 [Actinomadura graeca]